MSAAKATGLGEYQRIVGDAVGFDFQRGRCLAQDVQCRAHHLWLAAQAVRVLHAHVVVAVRFADARVQHQAAQGGSGCDLTALPTQGMDARIERRIRALRGFHRQRTGDQCGLEYSLDLEQTGQRIGGGELGAVEQCETFLRTQLDGLQAST